MADHKTTETTRSPIDRFTLRVLTPAGLVFDEQVSNVSLPAIDGEIGILPGHVRYTGILGVGLLRYDVVGGEKGKSIVVTGGFCNFADGILTLLADSVDLAESVDKTQLGKLKSEAEKALNSLSSYDEAWEAAAMKLKRSEAVERLVATVH